MLSRVREQTTKRLLLQAHLLLLVPQRRRRRRRRRRRLSRLSPRRRKLSRRSTDPMAGPLRTTGRFRSRSTPGDGCVQLACALPSLRAAAALVSTVVSPSSLAPPLLSLPPRPSSRSRPLQSLARLDGIRATYVHRAPLLARAALTPRHLPPLSSPLPPLPATPPSSYAPSFAGPHLLLVHGQVLDVY